MRGARKIDRLFAEHRLAGPGRLLDQVGVGVGRRADQDRVDVAGERCIARASRRLLRSIASRLAQASAAGVV